MASSDPLLRQLNDDAERLHRWCFRRNDQFSAANSRPERWRKSVLRIRLRRCNQPWQFRRFTGHIGDTQVYAGALSSSQVSSLYSAQAPSYVPKTYAQTVLADNPGAYYRLNETSGTTAADSSVHNNTATYVGSPLLNQPSRPSITPGIDTNGGTGWVDVPSAAVGNWASNAGTSFEVSFKTTGSGVILGQNDAGETVDGGQPGGWVPALYVGTDGKLRLSLFWHNNTSTINTDPVAVDDGKWHDAIVVYNGTAGVESLWVDGSLVASGNFAQFSYAGAYDYHLGVGYDTSWAGAAGGWDHFTGQIDDASFYQYALSNEQIAAHFAAVPEPASIGLLGLGCLGLMARRRRA